MQAPTLGTGLVAGYYAFSLAHPVLALLCLQSTREEIKHLDGRRVLRSLLKALIAAGAIYLTARIAPPLLGTGSEAPGRAIVIAVVGGASLAVYLVVASLPGIEEPRS